MNMRIRVCSSIWLVAIQLERSAQCSLFIFVTDGIIYFSRSLARSPPISRSLLLIFAFTITVQCTIHFNNDNGGPVHTRSCSFAFWTLVLVCVFITHKTVSFSVICFHYSVHLSLTEIMAFRFEIQRASERKKTVDFFFWIHAVAPGIWITC